MMSNDLLDTSHDGQLNLIFGAPNGAVGDAPLLAGFSDTLGQIQAVLTRLADGAIDSDQRNAYEEEYMLLANQKSDFVLDAIRYSDRIPLILHAADESYVNQTLLYGGFDTAGPMRALLVRLADAAIDPDQRNTYIEEYSLLANQASDFVLDAIHNRQFDLIFDAPLLVDFSDTLRQIQAVLMRLADGAIDSDQRNAYEEEYMLLANQKSDFVLDAIRYYDRIPLILHAADESYVNQTLLYGGCDTAGPIRALLTRLADGAIDSSQRNTYIEEYSLLANQASDFVLDAIHNRQFDLIFDAP
ncbi:MAG: hypothetical protein INF88_16840, partial [Roseomonas sp.]|nr:hypothetical protein [Roseomonas sp.]